MPPTRGGRCDGGVNDAAAGTGGAPGGADIVWPAGSGHPNESRRFTHDNCSYRELSADTTVTGDRMQPGGVFGAHLRF